MQSLPRRSPARHQGSPGTGTLPRRVPAASRSPGTVSARTALATPRAWERLSEDLARYGHGVLRSWIADGTVFTRINALTHIPLHPAADLRDDPEAASELAGMTVAVALLAFRSHLEHGTGWHPHRGASLRTFFLGQCLLRFPNEYRRWLREHRAGRCSGLLSNTFDIPDPAPGPGHLTALHLEALRILATAPERTRIVLAYLALGYTQRDVAALLHTTPKAVEMLLRRYRRRFPSDRHPTVPAPPSPHPTRPRPPPHRP
ncbi:hypothetical protein CTZ27_35330 [Streptomyces griseocarneus]|nr:hypothetical protein CTZ27_35330 [Streptomyces griseocarneus]